MTTQGDRTATTLVSRLLAAGKKVFSYLKLTSTMSDDSATLPQSGHPVDPLLRPPDGYTLLKRIGRGGFGEVWQAEAPGGIPCAIKFIFRSLDERDSQRELESLEIIKRVQHPYLLLTQRFEALNHRLVIVMELAQCSLRDLHKDCLKAELPGIPWPELLGYFREAAEALDHLHGQQILHRDIKPENILVARGHAKVADFGLARVTEGSTASVSCSGTPAYMSPEAWNGKASGKSDQYALALTYAELRLGHRVYSNRGMYELMLDHLKGTPNLGPLSEAEQGVILRALENDPRKRYPCCMDFVKALQEVMANDRS
jgi:serine/threonine protein kinase